MKLDSATTEDVLQGRVADVYFRREPDVRGSATACWRDWTTCRLRRSHEAQ